MLHALRARPRRSRRTFVRRSCLAGRPFRRAIRQSWPRIRQLTLGVRHFWLRVRQLTLGIRHFWPQIRHLTLGIRHFWLQIRQTTLAVRQSWLLVRQMTLGARQSWLLVRQPWRMDASFVARDSSPAAEDSSLWPPGLRLGRPWVRHVVVRSSHAQRKNASTLTRAKNTTLTHALTSKKARVMATSPRPWTSACSYERSAAQSATPSP